MKIEGYVTDKNNAPIANALIELKGENFVTLFSTESKEDGYYMLDIPKGQYPFNSGKGLWSKLLRILVPEYFSSS